jgi:hypothetical protein
MQIDILNSIKRCKASSYKQRIGSGHNRLRIPLMADSDSIVIADSVPGDGGHLARAS